MVKNLDNRIDGLKIKEYGKKTSLSSYMLTSTFNTKCTELENKIKDAVTKANTVKSDLTNYATKTDLKNITHTDVSNFAGKNNLSALKTEESDLNDYAKKTDVANDITTIKNDYVGNASLTSRLNDLKSQHIATEVKTIDDKT